jgi:hypothetical protein
MFTNYSTLYEESNQFFLQFSKYGTVQTVTMVQYTVCSKQYDILFIHCNLSPTNTVVTEVFDWQVV